jgi:uncharacterized membrane protein YphA (DoxX/SURF4 family)
MKVVVHLVRILLGAIFLVFGLNKLLPLFSTPPPQGTAAEFMGGLAAAGYFFPMLAIVEISAGLLLILGRFVPLAITMLAPVILNVLAFHVFLAPSGLPLAILLVVLNLSLAWRYRDSFRRLLRSEAAPRVRRGTPAPTGRRQEPAEA